MKETNMTPEQFTYWLKGFFELTSAGQPKDAKLVLTAEQVDMISKHLDYVFQPKVMQSTLTATDTIRLSEHPLVDLSPMSGGGTLESVILAHSDSKSMIC
jgi:hypothetical protein